MSGQEADGQEAAAVGGRGPLDELNAYAEYPRPVRGSANQGLVRVARAVCLGNMAGGAITLLYALQAVLMLSGYLEMNSPFRAAHWFILAAWLAGVLFGGFGALPKRPSIWLSALGGLLLLFVIVGSAWGKIGSPSLALPLASLIFVYAVFSGLAAFYLKRSVAWGEG